MYSAKLVEAHFWLALIGTLIYVFAVWNSGIIQGLMWRTYNDTGTLTYSVVDSLLAMHPYYIALTVGGLFRSEAHTSEFQSLMRISYAVLRFNKKIHSIMHIS